MISILKHPSGTFSLDVNSLMKFSLVSICFLPHINYVLRFMAVILLSSDPWVHVDCLFLVRGTLFPGTPDRFGINDDHPDGKP